MPVVLENLGKRFGDGAPVLDGVNASIGRGEFVALLGASGCGKSTLLNIIAGLEAPTSGALEVPSDGAAFMFQDAALFPWLTARENVELALKLRGVGKAERRVQAEGLLDDPLLIQLCMGIPYGAPNDPLTLMSLVKNLPQGAEFSAFSIGRDQLPYAAMAALAGGNVRVGLEDNLYLDKGVLATNGALVERAAGVLSGMGARIMGPAELREKLRLTKHG